jgi:hypothetical protein
MAKIHEEIIVLKLSKLIKDSDPTTTMITEDLISNLAAVLEELAGPGIIIEIDQV